MRVRDNGYLCEIEQNVKQQMVELLAEAMYRANEQR